MIWTLNLFLLLTLIEVNCSVADNECKVLTEVCREDPNCPNERVFFTLCMRKYDVKGQYISNPADHSSSNLAYQPVGNQEHRSYDSNEASRRLYSYQKSDGLFTRDSTEEENDNQVERHVIDDSSSSSSYTGDTSTSTAELQPFKNTKELLNIYNLYKRHSLKESIQFIQKKLNRDIINTSNEDRLKNFEHLPILHIENDIQNKARKDSVVLKKAVELLKKVNVLNRKRHTKHLNTKEIITGEKESIATVSDRKKKREDLTVAGVVPPHAADKKSERSKVPPYTANKKADSSQDREEVAVPIYTSIEEKKESHTQSDTSKDVIIELSNSVGRKKATELGNILQSVLSKTSDNTVSLERLDKNTVTFNVISTQLSAESVAAKLNQEKQFRQEIESKSGLQIVKASTSPTKATVVSASPLKPVEKSIFKSHITVFTAVISACTLVIIIAAVTVCLVKRRQNSSSFLAFKKQEAVQDYQELCRTQMSVVNSRTDDEDDETDKDNTMRHNWYEDQFPYNMDISTGHVILAYMEDHLRNENRLNKEWEALCSYKADDAETIVGNDPKHSTKNRYRDVLPYDRTRVKLREVLNVYHSDYINANYITDVDPQHPDYIATQGPLDNTVADFWQMVWEQGVVVIVNLTKLSDMGLPQCHRYWPEDGSEIYHIYEVHLISEHIWCDDYLVRSLYLKNLQTAETRTITQFHYLTWPDLSIPGSSKPLLEFRRKVNKCYRGQACPIIVHCNNGVGRTGTYILLDMVLNKMIKGAKEIDIAATLEHLRDQRPDMVKTKGQFEFALTAMAEEVTAILSAVPK